MLESARSAHSGSIGLRVEAFESLGVKISGIAVGNPGRSRTRRLFWVPPSPCQCFFLGGVLVRGFCPKHDRWGIQRALCSTGGGGVS